QRIITVERKTQPLGWIDKVLVLGRIERHRNRGGRRAVRCRGSVGSHWNTQDICGLSWQVGLPGILRGGGTGERTGAARRLLEIEGGRRRTIYARVAGGTEPAINSCQSVLIFH